MDKLKQDENTPFRQLLDGDEILAAYDRTARELEPAFERIAAGLPEEQRRVLVGYADSLKLARLRLQVLAGERLKETE